MNHFVPRSSEEDCARPFLRSNGMSSFHSPESVASDLCGRCLFRNHCLTIRLLGLPCGRDVAGCFAGCSGLLMVTHGQLEVEAEGRRRVLHEGEAWVLPSGEPFHLWVEETTDVVFFERRKMKTTADC